MNQKTFLKFTGITNIAYALTLLSVGLLFYVLLPINKINSDYSLLIKEPSWITLNTIAMFAIATGILGTIGMYIIQQEKSGKLMLAAFVLIIFAMIMKCSATSWEFIIWPALLANDPTAPFLSQSLLFKDKGILIFYSVFTILFIAGYILFGIASLRTRIFPKYAILLLMIGGPAYSILLSIPPFGIIGLTLYTAGILIFGLKLLR